MTMPATSSRRAVMLAALLFVLGFSTVFVALGASAFPDRRADPRLVGRTVDCRRYRHHRHGPAFPRADADRVLDAGRAAADPQAVGLVGVLCDGARPSRSAGRPASVPILAAILSVAAAQATVAKGAGAARGLFGGPRDSVSAGRLSWSSASLRWFARMKRHLAGVERAMGVLMVITGIGFLTGAMSGAQHLAASRLFRRCRISAKLAPRRPARELRPSQKPAFSVPEPLDPRRRSDMLHVVALQGMAYRWDDRAPDLGELEREVMQLVWATGETTAEEIRERLARKPKESTVRTVLRGGWRKKDTSPTPSMDEPMFSAPPRPGRRSPPAR